MPFAGQSRIAVLPTANLDGQSFGQIWSEIRQSRLSVEADWSNVETFELDLLERWWNRFDGC